MRDNGGLKSDYGPVGSQGLGDFGQKNEGEPGPRDFLTFRGGSIYFTLVLSGEVSIEGVQTMNRPVLHVGQIVQRNKTIELYFVTQENFHNFFETSRNVFILAGRSGKKARNRTVRTSGLNSNSN